MTPPRTLDGRALHDSFRVAEQWLAANREAINAINVYPVPDGDTGTNMLLTLRAGLDEASAGGAPASDVGAYMRAFSHGALLGARGNSGVILSQMLQGLTEALDGSSVLDGSSLCNALEQAADRAYEAVSEPVEGTMLTVLRDASRAARAAARTDAMDLVDTLAVATAAAESSVERTPDLLPSLRAAGVVDAGGQGVAVILAGLGYGVRGEPLPEAPLTAAGTVEMSGVAHEGHGHCVQYLVGGDRLDRDLLIAGLIEAGGESVIVVGDETALRVHVHAEDADTALAVGAAYGPLDAVSIDDMQAQHERWLGGHEVASNAPPAIAAGAVGVVAVVQGAGIAAAFRELGAAIVDGGPTSNPSAGELLEAARAVGAARVFLLPNDGNVILAAEQAAAEEPGRLTVIPTRSAPAGLAAALAWLPDGEPTALEEAMRAASEAVRTIAVTRAVRDATVDGIAVKVGDAIAMLDGRMVTRADGLQDALMSAVDRVLDEDAGGPHTGSPAELVTLYQGADAEAGEAVRIAERIRAAYPALEVEVIDGGQPHYPYLLGVE